MNGKPAGEPTTFPEKTKYLFKEIFDTVREPMLVLDCNLHVQKASARFYHHFKLTPEETLDRLVYELGNGQWDIPELRSLLEKILPANQVLNDFEVKHEFEGIGERTMLLNAQQIDHLQLILLAFEDITERKEAERVLTERAEFKKMADSMLHLVWRARSDGTLDFINQRHEEFNGLVQNADGTWEWLSVLHPDDQKPTVEAWKSALQEGSIYQKEHRLQCRNGAYRWHLTRAVPIKDEDGHIERWFGTGTDIENLKKAEREAAEARQKAEAATVAKSEFLANMSHELRTPMTIFLAALEHLARTDFNPEHQRLLQMANKSAKNLHDLIDDILDFSRIEAGRVEIHPEPLAVRPWIEEVVGMFRPLAREKKLRLISQVAEDVPAIIEADAIRLKQILTNLVGNAIKFTPQGEVNVTVKTSDDSLEFAVADTGIGIPEDKQHLLFESFSQVDSSLQRNYGGTGLGLAISSKLAELMEGRISVWTREGEGSHFTLTLPLQIPTSQEQEASVQAVAAPGDASSYRILLAEDDPMIRELVVRGLAQRGWHIEVARSGKEALGMWVLRPFDVILMDLQMPDMDGLEATRQIRAREYGGGERVCIIGVTAHARREIIENCLKEGMDEILTKPIKSKYLEETILRFMEKE